MKEYSPRRFVVLTEREIRGEVLAPKGAVVFDQWQYDYCLADDDTRATGIEHRTVTFNSNGDSPGFTIAESALRELFDDGKDRTVETADRRTALLIARTILFHLGSEFDYSLTARQFGAGDFEAELIGFACHWSNDLLDLALSELSIEIPEDLQAPTFETGAKRAEFLTEELLHWPSLIKHS